MKISEINHNVDSYSMLFAALHEAVLGPKWSRSLMAFVSVIE
jgi:hypothetical protein